MGAMAHGASAEEAVRLTTKYSVWSAGEPQVMHVGRERD